MALLNWHHKSQITTTKSKESPEKLYSSGKVLNYRKIKITEEGEILVKGETLFKGYIESKKNIKSFDSDGWFHTGDLGNIDDEGYLSVIGRKDSMFISGGENIYPEEIEKALISNEEISDALVIDIPDSKFGARLVAFIKTNSEITEKKKIVEFLSNNILKFKIPDSFYMWPQNFSTFKPNRSEFKKYFNTTKLKEIV